MPFKLELTNALQLFVEKTSKLIDPRSCRKCCTYLFLCRLSFPASSYVAGSQNVSVLSTEFWIHQCISAPHCLHLLSPLLLSKLEPNSGMNCPGWYWQGRGRQGLKDCKYQLAASRRWASSPGGGGTELIFIIARLQLCLVIDYLIIVCGINIEPWPI